VKELGWKSAGITPPIGTATLVVDAVVVEVVEVEEAAEVFGDEVDVVDEDVLEAPVLLLQAAAATASTARAVPSIPSVMRRLAVM
jgi:hypothetical protein